MPDYKFGKIYKICNSVNDIVYVGSTCQTLAMRMAGHRANAKFQPFGALYPAMLELGIEKFRIILVEEYPCTSKSHLEAKEFQIMSEMKAAGTVLYNLFVDGKHSEETCKKMSDARREKVGAANGHFKRGSVSFDSTNSQWRFVWREDGKQKSKSFSVNKYGHDSAKGLVLAFRDEIYTEEPEDESEFIRELRNKINS